MILAAKVVYDIAAHSVSSRHVAHSQDRNFRSLTGRKTSELDLLFPYTTHSRVLMADADAHLGLEVANVLNVVNLSRISCTAPRLR
jgi:hypothetical protein